MGIKQKIIIGSLSAILLNSGAANAVNVCYESEAPLSGVSQTMGIRKCGENERLRYVRWRDSTFKKIEDSIKKAIPQGDKPRQNDNKQRNTRNNRK